MPKPKHLPQRADILAAIENELETEALDINVDVTDERIVISGFVDVLQDRIAISHAVDSVAGSMPVENKVTVATDGTITESEIKEAIERKLANSGLPVPGITVNSGRVQLQGRVENLEDIRRITERTGEVLGVSEIDTTQLRIERVRDDASLKNRIEAALATVVSAPDVDTIVDEGRVQLKGYVASQHDLDEVSRAVIAIDGVQRVDNRLQVRNNQAD